MRSTNEQTVDDSLASQFDDFEDALQYYSTLKSKADVIITRNGEDFKLSKIPVMTAGEYLATID
jgi:archaellum component FlaF (FlaF/FlaG flagellin family)